MQRKTGIVALASAAALFAASTQAQNYVMVPAPEQQTQASQLPQQDQGRIFVMMPEQQAQQQRYQQMLRQHQMMQQQRMQQAQQRPAAAGEEGTLIVQLSPTETRRAQRRLRELGYSDQPADARWDLNDQQALARFQEEEGMQPTGLLDLPTLIALDIQPQERRAPQAAYLTVDPSLAEDIEQRVAELGFTDPATGEVTRRSVAAFQQSQGLEPTGLLDARTITALELISDQQRQRAQQQAQLQQKQQSSQQRQQDEQASAQQQGQQQGQQQNQQQNQQQAGLQQQGEQPQGDQQSQQG